MINWKTRIKNKNFWIALIPAILLQIQSVLTPFGYKWDFGVLSILGIVTDPTTVGIGDSSQALGYDEPKKY